MFINRYHDTEDSEEVEDLDLYDDQQNNVIERKVTEFKRNSNLVVLKTNDSIVVAVERSADSGLIADNRSR